MYVKNVLLEIFAVPPPWLKNALGEAKGGGGALAPPSYKRCEEPWSGLVDHQPYFSYLNFNFSFTVFSFVSSRPQFALLLFVS